MSVKLHPDLERRIARAEAAVAVIKPKFREALMLELTRLDALAETGELEDLLTLVHDIKGNAGGFGFNLVSNIATCLDAYLRAIAHIEPQDTKIIRDHGNSMAIAATEPLDAEAREQIEEFITLSGRLAADARDHP